MVVRRRKKSRKYRGERHMRRGYNDRNRNWGVKGGKAMSGWKKKGHKLFKILKEFKEKFEDKRGFTRPNYVEKYIAINLSDIENHFEKFKSTGIVEEGEELVLDLTKLGRVKLLGKGSISRKMKIIVNKATQNAVEKVKKVGGVVEIKAF